MLDRNGPTDAGVVHEHVDPTEPIEHLGHERVRARSSSARSAAIAREPGISPTSCSEPSGPSGGHDHLRADGMEDAGEVIAETGRRAGDDDHLIVETETIERVGREGW